MHFRTNEDMNRAILYGLRHVPPDVDLIVGIPRSGLLAAMFFSLYLNKPVTDFAGLAERRLLATGKRPLRAGEGNVFDSARRILVVDDCVSQGTEMDKARARVAELGLADRCTFLAVYSFPEHPEKADIVLETIPRPMAFQWSCMHSRNLASFCVEIDGLLCADATTAEDDDGANYLRFLENARPLFTPVVEIGWLVTCRLEKYRPQTEAWLARHGIRYRNLVMMDHPTREAREAADRHAEYKARVYTESGAELFIESNSDLARKIAERTGKPVLSFETNALVHPRASDRLDILQQRAQWWLRRLRRAPGKARKLISARLRGVEKEPEGRRPLQP